MLQGHTLVTEAQYKNYNIEDQLYIVENFMDKLIHVLLNETEKRKQKEMVLIIKISCPLNFNLRCELKAKRRNVNSRKKWTPGYRNWIKITYKFL